MHVHVAGIAPARGAFLRGSVDGSGADPLHTDVQYETMERSTLPECSDSTASIVAARPL